MDAQRIKLAARCIQMEGDVARLWRVFEGDHEIKSRFRTLVQRYPLSKTTPITSEDLA